MKKILIISVIIVIISFAVYKYRKNKTLQGIYEKNFDDGIVTISENGKNRDIKISFSGWFSPYDEKGKTNLKKLTLHKYGVYLIRERKTQNIVYIGYSGSSLYKAMYRHFQSYNDEHLQHRATYNKNDDLEVSIILSKKTQAPKIEKAMIIEYQPRDCKEKYDNYTTEIDFKEVPEPEYFEEWEIESEPAPF